MRASSAPGATISVANPCSSAHSASRGSPLRRSSRAAVSPRSSGSRSVPALLATSPIATSGVSRRTRLLQSRRSQLAANSSAPPTHTPSTTATTGTGAARTTRVIRWKASIVSAHAAVSASIAAWRSSPAEKCPPAPRTATMRTSVSRPATSISAAIAVIVGRSQALRRSWRSQVITLAAPRSDVVTVIGRAPFSAGSRLRPAAGRRARCDGRCGSCARPRAATPARAA